MDALYAGAPADEQHIQRFLSANCFGDHYTRGGVDIPPRELLTFAMLVALGGCDPQARGHVAANLNVSVTSPLPPTTRPTSKSAPRMMRAHGLIHQPGSLRSDRYRLSVRWRRRRRVGRDAAARQPPPSAGRGRSHC
ncbi:carboxymuconolactone decarboxylase family protein [Frankia sp. EAN1pec]|uniref:carboxymuconolactone decarboxylase family protein n=1 Tax=Parafrankia sp. (strain EAN1pec) TaxID=298653 RepID=UPI0018DBD907